MSGSSGYNCPNRSISGLAAGVLSREGSLTGWSHVSLVMPASVSKDRIVDTHASKVRSVPARRSRTRSLGFVGGGSVCTSAQHRSNILRRRSSEMLIVGRSDVQSAATNNTNWRSGMPGCWTSSDCIRMPLSTEGHAESITQTVTPATYRVKD